MSSLSATQADGYYVPPEYYDSGQYKKKSRNQFAGSKGHNQYLTSNVVRFELPHDGFCTGCGAHVGKGTRFNAHKQKAGNYFTTTIYKFTMKCRICAIEEFVIQTDPKNRDFEYVQGIHRQVQEFDTAEAGTAGVIDTENGNKIISATTSSATDGLARLESVASGKRKTMTEEEQLRSLVQLNAKTFFTDADSNAALRSKFRVDRKRRKQRLKDASARGWKEGMELAEETTGDASAARDTCFGSGKRAERERFQSLKTTSIFSKRPSKRRPKSESRPDRVDSSSIRHANERTSHTAAPRIKQEDGGEKIRIRLVPNGTKLARENTSATTETKETQPPLSSSLAALADYGSDSD